MATYYVKTAADGGSDGAAGTSAATAWATIGKALGASGISSGDTLWIAPGTYREIVTVAMTSATVETKIYGDPSASQFSGIAPGSVIWSAYTTNDTTTSSTSVLLTISGRDFLTFQDIVFIGSRSSTATCVTMATATSTDITFRRCVFNSIGSTSGPAIIGTTAANVAANWLFDSCVVLAGTHGLRFTLTRPATADFDVAITVKNCFILCMYFNAAAVLIATTGANSFKPGALHVISSTLIAQFGVYANSSVISTSIPCTIVSSFIVASNYALASDAASQLTEDYNYLGGFNLRLNVSIGSNSKDSPTYAPLIEIGQSWLHGFMPRPFMSPMAGAPMLGFGDDGTAPSVDALNRPRPAGGNSTAKGVGYLERHDTAAKETTTTDAGSVGLVIVGPGDHDIKIPVDAALTTISVKMRYDATHNTTNKPQAILLANPAIGVTTETLTMSAAVDTWETLTFTPQTPSAKGVVTVRLVSRSAAAGGKAFADTASVT